MTDTTDRPTTLRPTAAVLPIDRLRNLVDRACRAAPEPPPYPFLCPGPDTTGDAR